MHKYFKHPAVVGGQQVDDNHKFPQRLGEGDEVGIEDQSPGSRGGGTFGRHCAQMHLGCLHADAYRPVARGPVEIPSAWFAIFSLPWLNTSIPLVRPNYLHQRTCLPQLVHHPPVQPLCQRFIPAIG